MLYPPLPFFLRPPTLCMHASSLLQARRRPCGPQPTRAPARPARDAAPALPLLPATTQGARPSRVQAGAPARRRQSSPQRCSTPSASLNSGGACIPDGSSAGNDCGAELTGGRGQEALKLQRVVGRRRCTGHRTEYAGGRGVPWLGRRQARSKADSYKKQGRKKQGVRARCTPALAGAQPTGCGPSAQPRYPATSPLPRLPLSWSGAPRRTRGMRAVPGVLQRQPG